MQKHQGKAPGHPVRLPGMASSARMQSSDTLLKQGIGYQAKGQFREAETCYRKVLASEPENAMAHNLMGMLALAVMKTMEEDAKGSPVAIEYFTKAVEFDPRKSDFRSNLGHAYLEYHDRENARKCLRKALDLDARNAGALCDLGRLFTIEEKYGQAEKYFRRALAVEPNNIQALSELGHIMIINGALAEAEALFGRALALDAGNIRALIGLAGARKASKGDPVRKLIEARLSAGNLKDSERAELHQSAGKVLNDIGEYEAAIDHYSKANALLEWTFDLDRHTRLYDSWIEQFDADFFEARKDFGDPSDRLVFIVGMPRSGTTLTEQICASHRRIHGAGETENVREMAQELGFNDADRGRFIEAMKSLTREESKKLAGRLLEKYRKADRKALRIVEKMPHNFEELPLIALLFPNAHIVHCRRNAMDNCVSIYSLNFNVFHSYSRDLTTLGRYYTQYDRLMRHWAQVVPLPMIEMKYEETVADLENRARALIDFLGVDWDDNCLRFHETERSVNTSSRWQVRQPIYSSSVKRWKRYGAALDPLKEALGPMAEDD